MTVVRHPTESWLAAATILVVFLNYYALIWIQVQWGPDWKLLALDFALNSLLLFAGTYSLYVRPASNAQPLAATWMFAPFPSSSFSHHQADNFTKPAELFNSKFGMPVFLFSIVIVVLLFWSITLAIRQSRMEINQNKRNSKQNKSA